MNEISKKPLVDMLSEQLGKRIVMSAGDYVEFDNKSIVPQSEVDIALLTQEADYITELKVGKQSEITQAFDSSVKALTTALPHEMVSWRKQEDEARTWNADNTVATSFVDAQLATRNLGETKQELVDKIIANADAYAVRYAGLLGKYQNLVSQINSATTVAELELIKWEI